MSPEFYRLGLKERGSAEPAFGLICCRMETTLNLVWLLVAFTLFGLWAFKWLPVKREQHACLFGGTLALVFALALLFAPISLTDDLHPEIVVVDAASGKRNTTQWIAVSSRARDSDIRIKAESAAVALEHPLVQLAFCFGALILFSFYRYPSVIVSICYGRAPPTVAF